MAKLPPSLSTFWRGCLDALTTLRNAPSLWHASAHPHTPSILDLPCIPVQLTCRVKTPSIRSLGDLSLQRLCQVAQPSAQKQRMLQQHLDAAHKTIPTQVAFNRDMTSAQTRIGQDGAIRPTPQHTVAIAPVAQVKASWVNTPCHALPKVFGWRKPSIKHLPLLHASDCHASQALTLNTASNTCPTEQLAIPTATAVHLGLQHHPFSSPHWHTRTLTHIAAAHAHPSNAPWAIPMAYAPWPLKNIPPDIKATWLGLLAEYLDLPTTRLWVIAAYFTPHPRYFEALPQFQSQHLQWGQCEAMPKLRDRFHFGPTVSHPPGLWLVIRPLQLSGRQQDTPERSEPSQKALSPQQLLTLAQKRHAAKGGLLKAPASLPPPNNGTPPPNIPITAPKVPSYWVCLPQALACFFEDPGQLVTAPHLS